jgi:hypothetical protein
MIKRLSVSLAIVFCLLAILPAHHPASAKDTWTSVRSTNFFLVGNANEKEIRQVATRLEQFRNVFSRLFPGFNFRSPVPTTVIVFKNDSSYTPFKPKVDGKPVAVAGYFQAGRDATTAQSSTSTFTCSSTTRSARPPYHPGLMKVSPSTTAPLTSKTTGRPTLAT